MYKRVSNAVPVEEVGKFHPGAIEKLLLASALSFAGAFG
jgi:hypothetical protein